MCVIGRCVVCVIGRCVVCVCDREMCYVCDREMCCVCDREVCYSRARNSHPSDCPGQVDFRSDNRKHSHHLPFGQVDFEYSYW